VTKPQIYMYRAEWAKVRAYLREHGMSPKEADAQRMIIHVKVGAVNAQGEPTSSIFLSNKEFDRVLALFWAYTQPGSLTAQLRQVNQSLTRAEASEAAQAWLAILVRPEDGERGREAYLDAICKRIHKKPLMDIDDDEWIDVLAALDHTRKHRQGVAHQHKPHRQAAPPPASLITEDCPF
jgi:hypothetical protein